MADDITQEQLKREIHYDPLTGRFRRLIKRTNAREEVDMRDADGYLRICVMGRRRQANRLAWLYMTGEWPAGEVDHIDRDPANDRWTNLRDTTRKQNLENSVEQVNNTSGHRGVHLRTWRNHRPMWVARIGHNGRRIHLGAFVSKAEAVEFRDLAESMLYTCAPRA